MTKFYLGKVAFLMQKLGRANSLQSDRAFSFSALSMNDLSNSG